MSGRWEQQSFQGYRPVFSTDEEMAVVRPPGMSNIERTLWRCVEWGQIKPQELIKKIGQTRFQEILALRDEQYSWVPVQVKTVDAAGIETVTWQWQDKITKRS